MLKILRMKKMRTLLLSLEKNNVTPKLEIRNLSAETYNPNPEIMLTQKTDSNFTSKPQIGKNCIHCHKSNHSFSN